MSYHSKLRRIKREYQSDVEERSSVMKKIKIPRQYTVYVVFVHNILHETWYPTMGYLSFQDARKAILMQSSHPQETNNSRKFISEGFEYYIDDVQIFEA